MVSKVYNFKNSKYIKNIEVWILKNPWAQVYILFFDKIESFLIALYVYKQFYAIINAYKLLFTLYLIF